MSESIDPPYSLMEDPNPVSEESSDDWSTRANQESDQCPELSFLKPPHSKMFNMLLRLEKREIPDDDYNKLIESLKIMNPASFDAMVASVGAKETPVGGIFKIALDLYIRNIERKLCEEIFLSLAELGHPQSQCFYADILRLRGQMKEAIPYYERAAYEDDVALYNLAYSLYKGDGQARNLELAMEYFKLGADQGDCDAQHAYGILIRDSDPYEAALYLKLAADNDCVQAMCSYGNLLDEYFDDHETAVSYWEQALCNGHYRALDSIGRSHYRRYIKALEASKDDEADEHMTQAVSFWRKAAEAEDPIGLHSYGWALKVGFGVAKNYEEAINHFKQAASKGVSESYADWAEILFAQGERTEAEGLLEKAKRHHPTFEFVGEYRDYPKDAMRSLQTMSLSQYR